MKTFAELIDKTSVENIEPFPISERDLTFFYLGMQAVLMAAMRGSLPPLGDPNLMNFQTANEFFRLITAVTKTPEICERAMHKITREVTAHLRTLRGLVPEAKQDNDFIRQSMEATGGDPVEALREIFGMMGNKKDRETVQ